MIVEQQFEKAKFTYTAEGQQKVVPVNFNPASLEHTITANSQGSGGQSTQVVGSSSAKLNMELFFDTTDTGDDVRKKTHEIEMMLKPSTGTGGVEAPPQVAPSVLFEWGAFRFEGIVDSFKQTMDFFSSNGVPLRAAITLSLSQAEYRFDQRDSGRSANVGSDLVLSGGDASSLAAAGGDPFSARAIASANGLESLRAAAGGQVSVGGRVSIGAAASFSAGAGAGFGISGGASAGLGLGVGAQASAGVSASAGAFGGLHAETSASPGKYFDAQKIFAEMSAPAVAPGAQFDVTGKAVASGTSGFKAEVGARIQFDE